MGSASNAGAIAAMLLGKHVRLEGRYFLRRVIPVVFYANQGGVGYVKTQFTLYPIY